MGGTDNPSNLIELTVEEHAEAHRTLYDKYGKQEDYLAWRGLSGHIGKEEIIRERCSLGGLNSQKNRRDKGLDVYFLNESEEQLFKWRSEAGKLSTNKGAKWYYNGKDYKFVTEQPEGYIPSQAPNKPGKLVKDTFWWNNGIKHKRSSVSPGSEWVKGRINKGNLGGARMPGLS